MPDGNGRSLGRAFYDRDPRVVAPALLGKLLVHDSPDGLVGGRIVEVEAYGGADDPASHAHRGRTPRNASMFGPPGLLYVYFSYGMHWCANAVCGPQDVPGAVLIRALRPTLGVAAMWARRPAARRERDLCSGPAKLCAALGIDRRLDGADLVTGAQGVQILDDGLAPPVPAGTSTRVGISVGREHEWRWFVPDDPHRSRAG